MMLYLADVIVKFMCTTQMKTLLRTEEALDSKSIPEAAKKPLAIPFLNILLFGLESKHFVVIGNRVIVEEHCSPDTDTPKKVISATVRTQQSV